MSHLDGGYFAVHFGLTLTQILKSNKDLALQKYNQQGMNSMWQ